jgi:TrmH family RNA methyltransferase
MEQHLDNLTIVLVDTKTPANIGATARCMMNMGLSRLTLVRPPDDPRQEALKLAAGADAVLANAHAAPDLASAVADCGIVIGTSRHQGRQRTAGSLPREVAERTVPFLTNAQTAVVFGNEVNGLMSADLGLCTDIISIPSSPAFPSLNLSHAVMVVAYELFIAASRPHPPSYDELARHEDLEHFYTHLQRTLQTVGFFEETSPDRMMLSLRRIFSRARLSPRDLAVLRGILSSVDAPRGRS